MKLRDYQQQCAITEGDYKKLPWNMDYAGTFWRLQHAAEGLATELGELIGSHDKTNLLEELGDLCWYAAIGLHALGIGDSMWTDAEPIGSKPAKDCWSPVDSLSAIILGGGGNPHSRGLLDLMKRWKFYRKREKGWEDDMATKFDGVLFIVSTMANREGWTMDMVLTANVEKLTKKRYKAGFTPHESVNRNVEAERLALEARLNP